MPSGSSLGLRNLRSGDLLAPTWHDAETAAPGARCGPGRVHAIACSLGYDVSTVSDWLNMTDPGVRPVVEAGRSVMRPLSGRALLVAAAVAVVVTAVVVLVLWWPATRGLNGTELVAARFDALRIGLSIGVGSGGVIVLYLAWRRQRSTEDTLAHQERVAAITERDAVERRITDLYTKSADQLGSDKAPVRLAGLYALERLAQDNPTQRRTIVNVLCAYLRMPFDLPFDPPAPPDGDSTSAAADFERQRYRELLADHRDGLQEQEVRHAAQRILATHTNPGPGGVDDPVETYWADLELDLGGATLDALDFSGCHLRAVSLANARIAGTAKFIEASIDDATFHGVTIGSDVTFRQAKFGRGAVFRETVFGGDADWALVEFGGDADFWLSEFSGDAVFYNAEFHGAGFFKEVKFGGRAEFDHAKFDSNAEFYMGKFGGVTQFRQTKFGSFAGFYEAMFGYVTFHGAQFGNDVVFRGAEFGDDVKFDGAEFKAAVVIEDASFTRGVPNELAAHTWRRGGHADSAT